MTNEEINIAIAEACGWRIAGRVLPEYKESATACWIRPNGDEWQEESLPDYCNDLNAIRDAVMTLPENKRVLYGVRLAWECGHTDKKSVGLWHISTATAYHRAVAFLKVLEKCEE